MMLPVNYFPILPNKPNFYPDNKKSSENYSCPSYFDCMVSRISSEVKLLSRFSQPFF